MINESYRSASKFTFLYNYLCFHNLNRVLSVSLGNVYFGYALAYYGITQTSIVYILGYEDYNYKYILDGLINSVIPLGGAVGAFISGKLIHLTSFRQLFIICDIIGIANAFGSLYLTYWSLIITRFIYGILVGINSTVDPQYIQQLVPNQLSGIYGIFCNLGLLIGLTMAFVLSWIFLQSSPTLFDPNEQYGIFGFNSWRIMFAFPIITCTLRMIVFAFFHKENLPQEYIKKGLKHKAISVIIKYYKEQFALEVYDELEQEFQLQGQKNITYRDLFGPNYSKGLVVGSLLSVLNQGCGINAVNFYAVIIFSQISNNNFSMVNLLTVMDGVVSIFATLFAGVMINKFGRRIMFLIGNALCFLSLASLAVLYQALDNTQDTSEDKTLTLQILTIIALFTFIVAFSMSLGPVFWVYIAEILPPKGIGLVVLQNWILLALLAQFFPILVANYSVSLCFGIFAFVCFLGEIFIWYDIKETKKLSRSQIHNIFSKYHVPGSKTKSTSQDSLLQTNEASLQPYN